MDVWKGVLHNGAHSERWSTSPEYRYSAAAQLLVTKNVFLERLPRFHVFGQVRVLKVTKVCFVASKAALPLWNAVAMHVYESGKDDGTQGPYSVPRVHLRTGTQESSWAPKMQTR